MHRKSEPALAEEPNHPPRSGLPPCPRRGQHVSCCFHTTRFAAGHWFPAPPLVGTPGPWRSRKTDLVTDTRREALPDIVTPGCFACPEGVLLQNKSRVGQRQIVDDEQEHRALVFFIYTSKYAFISYTQVCFSFLFLRTHQYCKPDLSRCIPVLHFVRCAIAAGRNGDRRPHSKLHRRVFRGNGKYAARRPPRNWARRTRKLLVLQ